MSSIKIAERDIGKRLDKFLVKQLPKLSRSQIQKLIKSSAVMVNEKTVPAHYFLRQGDLVTIIDELIERVSKPERKISGFHPTIHNFQTLPNPRVSFTIVSEDPHYIIIDKPAGLIMHQSKIHTEADTLANGLLARFPEIKGVGEDPFRPGIVHRLDKYVSGLVVVARTQEMFQHLKQQFKNRDVKKIYIALVYGSLTKEDGTIDFPISRSKKAGVKMAAHSKMLGGKEAITQYEVLRRFQHYTLVKVQIKTGRTHQIRLHFNALGYPVVGERVYKPKKLRKIVNLGRIFLHASRLGFYDLKNKWQEFYSEPDKELKEFLKELI